MPPGDEKQIGAWRIGGVGAWVGVKNHLMAPSGSQHGGPLAKGVRIWRSQVTAGHGIVVDRCGSFPDNNFQAAVIGDLMGDGVVVEGKQRGGFVLRDTSKINRWQGGHRS